MNRRGFLRALGAVPVIAAVPAIVARWAPTPAAVPVAVDGFQAISPDGATSEGRTGGWHEYRDGRLDIYNSRGVVVISMGDLS